MPMDAGITHAVPKPVTKAAAQVFLVCYGFQMLWIDAKPITAQMVNDEPFRDWPVGALVGVSVCQHATPLAATPEFPVTRALDRADPLDAALGSGHAIRVEAAVTVLALGAAFWVAVLGKALVMRTALSEKFSTKSRRLNQACRSTSTSVMNGLR